MFIQCLCDMGCGRSRHNSATKIEDSDIKENTRKKSSKQQDKKENKDPVRPLQPKGGSAKKEKATSKKIVEKLSDSPSRTRTPWMNGSSQPPKLENSNGGLKTEKFNIESKTKTAFKDRPVVGNKPNVQVTGSQLEFFRMLDERIEQGKDYSDD